MYTESDSNDYKTIWEMAYNESSAREKAYNDFHNIVKLDLIKTV